MNWFESLILGLVQGITEFLPVSSSGHLEIGKVIFGNASGSSLAYTVTVHAATVLSTLVIFRKEIIRLFGALFRFRWDEDMHYIMALLVSMIPVAIVGFLFNDLVESFFTGKLVLVGCMLLVTAVLLTFAHFSKDRGRDISLLDALVIGVAQAIAVLPGLSRSGATIATGMMLGNKRSEVARFSFLMVIIPVIGATLKDVLGQPVSTEAVISPLVLLIGFLAAFVSGLLACRFMIRVVQKGSLLGFAVYCVLAGTVAIILGW